MPVDQGTSHTGSNALNKALGHLRASGGIDYDVEAFADALASGEAGSASARAVEEHLREADPAGLLDLVAEGAASFATLACLAARFLEGDHPNAAFLDRCASAWRTQP